MLDPERCYINLAIVEGFRQRQNDQEQLKAQARSFVRMESYEKVNGTKLEAMIPIEDLFEKRRLLNGKDDIPKKILIQGRAGIGKTTLCKKLVQIFLSGRWNERFEAVIWIPLRYLKTLKSQNLEYYVRETYFAHDCDKRVLTRLLLEKVQDGKVLFILDGLDEIIHASQTDYALESFLAELFRQKHVIVTSRPSGIDGKTLPTLDLELETVGFCQDNVKDYVNNVLDTEPAKSVLDFIQKTPIIQSLANIPVQLDVICHSWKSLLKNDQKDPITITGLYRGMINKLWISDIVRLGKYSIAQLDNIREDQVNREMTLEIEFLRCLAFKGIQENRIEFDNDTLYEFFSSLDQRNPGQSQFPIDFLDNVKQTSFLNTAEADLDVELNSKDQSWHFIHLTFQDYFAAMWLANQFPKPQAGSTNRHTTLKWEEAKNFIQRNKYDPRYEIVWWMLAGQLDGDALELFFGVLRSEPIDLVGARHALLLSGCYSESAYKMKSQLKADIEEEIARVLHTDITINRDINDGKLGEQQTIPENILIRHCFTTENEIEYTLRALQRRQFKAEKTSLYLIDIFDSFQGGRWNCDIVKALRSLSSLPDKVINFVVSALTFQDCDIRTSAAEILIGQPLTLLAVRSLVDFIKYDSPYAGQFAAKILLSQSTLSSEALQLLNEVLKDNQSYAAKIAGEVVGKQSKQTPIAFQSLVSALNDGNKGTGTKSWTGEPPPTIQPLVEALKERYPNVRQIEAETLGRQPSLPSPAIQSLIEALGDRTKDHTKVSGDRPSFSPSDIQLLLGTLKDNAPYVRSSVVKALATLPELRPPVIQYLITALKDVNEGIRSISAEVLGSQSSLSISTIRALIGTLKDKVENVRSKAAEALGNQSTLTTPIILDLVGAIKDNSPDVRSSIVGALGRQPSLPEAAIKSLINALEDDSYTVRLTAVKALGTLSPLPRSVIEALIKHLRHGDGYIKGLVSKALGSHSTLPDSAIHLLIKTLKEGPSNVSLFAAEALGSQSALCSTNTQVLLKILKEKDEALMPLVTKVLCKQSNLDPSAIDFLLDTLKDESLDLRQMAAEVLKSQTLLQHAITPLIESLNDKTLRTRLRAVEVLGSQSSLPPFAIQPLVDALNDESQSVRSLAAKVLGSQSVLHPSAIQSLIDALRNGSSVLRSLAASILGDQSTIPSSAIQALIDALKDEDANVKLSADEALAKHSTLSSSVILHLIDGLKNENEGVTSTAAGRSESQSLLSHPTAQSQIDTIKEDNNDTWLLADAFESCEAPPISAAPPVVDSPSHTELCDARSMAHQSALPTVAVLALFGVLRYERDDAQKVCKAIPLMSIEEIEKLFKN
ncbi:hypothetical protein BGZ76_008635, partial [Entomortierella beljakovae]